jgi:hypothetical protein
MVRRLQAQVSRQVIAVVDEHNAPVDIPSDILKVTLEPAGLGLLVPADYGWRCGDYSLYAALAAAPEASDFWLIEPDVRIHSATPGAFFDGTEATRGADFVTGWFVTASAGWLWYNTISPFVPHPFNCMMQLCRVSHAAVARLLQERRILSQRFQQDRLDIRSWPNDEAFVGAKLVEHGFRVVTFKEHAPDFRTAGTFTFTRPTSARWLDSVPPDNGIYHPVEQGERFVARAKAYLDAVARNPAGSDGASPDPDEELKQQLRIESQPDPGPSPHG